MPSTLIPDRRAKNVVGLAIGLVLLAIGVPWVASPAGAQEEPAWAGVEPTLVAEDVHGPVDLEVAPNGELWWAAFFTGNLVRYDPVNDTREVLFHVEPFEDPVERGLVGLALDPQVLENDAFYVYYTEKDPDQPDRGTNYLSRVEDGEETRLLNLSAHKRHNGGRIVFDDDGRLFVSTGDNDQGYPAQDPGSLLGKILHLHPDGRPANDTIEGYVYSMGHRNVYGLAFDEETDRLFATENGHAERDEVNLVRPGANYGWPHCHGYHRYDYEEEQPAPGRCRNSQFEDPIGVFFDERTAAPTGATMFQGDLYWAAWNDGDIHRMEEDPETGEWTDTVVYDAEGYGNLLDIETHAGDLYFTNFSDVYRIDDVACFPAADTGGTGLLWEVPGLPLVAVGLAFAIAAGARRRDR